MNLEQMKAMLLLHENIRLKPYLCTSGKTTIGIGRNITDKGITAAEAFMLCENDILECEHDLDLLIFPGIFYAFPETIQHVLIDLRFNLGKTGFRQFKRMIKAFKENDYREAIKEMKDSKWYSQVKNRADHLITLIEGTISEVR